MTRTATWEQDRRGGHRARPGALQPRALRQGTWAALDRAAAARAHPVGGPCLGAAVPHGARPLRALHPAAAPSLPRSQPLPRWARHLIPPAQRAQPDPPRVVVRGPTHDARARLCDDRAVEPLLLVSWFVLRGQREVTLREVRAPLGFATQRPWSERAVARTTPALLGLYARVARLAHDQLPAVAPLRRAAS